MILTNDIVDSLISALKQLIQKNRIIIFPSINEKIKLDAVSADKRYEFTIIINRIIVRPDKPTLKISFLILYKNSPLMRIDLGGSDHKNSDVALEEFPDLNEVVPCPHIHIFDETYNIAYPLYKYCNYDNIQSVNDLIEIFIEFLELNNINNINNYTIQPKLDTI